MYVGCVSGMSALLCGTRPGCLSPTILVVKDPVDLSASLNLLHSDYTVSDVL